MPAWLVSPSRIFHTLQLKHHPQRESPHLPFLSFVFTSPLGGVMSPATTCAGVRLRRRDRLCILNAKSGFSLDRLQTIFKGCKATICGAAGEICAPLRVLLNALCLCAASECAPDSKVRNRRQQQQPPRCQSLALGFLKCGRQLNRTIRHPQQVVGAWRLRQPRAARSPSIGHPGPARRRKDSG